MSETLKVLSCALPPQLAAWRSLVSRSIAAWDNIAMDEGYTRKDIPKYLLEECHSIDDFFDRGVATLMFWFFQRRSAFMSQKSLKQWSRNNLDDYVLLPASRGFVMRCDCFFVSHFWRSQDHPDPDGKYLRLHQAELEPQTWSYIWVDWTCMPQSPRSLPEESYFYRCLRTMSGIIRNCGFIYFYPPFEARLWILYEIIEYELTCDADFATTPDIEIFHQHIKEMLKTGVRATLTKYGYRCSFDRDREYLIPWLELLVLLRQLHFDVDFIREIMDNVTWFRVCEVQMYPGVELKRFEGTLVVGGKMHTFTPFPQWIDGKYSVQGIA